MPKQIAQSWPNQYEDAVLLTSGVVCPRGAGSGLLITATVTGTVNLTLLGGAVIPVNYPLGSTVYPFQVTLAVVSSGTITSMYNLIGSGGT